MLTRVNTLRGTGGPADWLERTIDDQPISRLQIRVVGLCAIACLLDGFDLQALGLAIPLMAQDFGLVPSSFTMAVTATLIGMVLGAVVVAPFGDRWGRRPLILACMVSIGLSSLGVAASSTPAAIAIWRCITGLGLGAMVPAATAMGAEHLPARRRTSLVAMMICCIPLGTFVASLSAPAVSELWGWKGILVVGGVIPLVFAAFLAVTLPESARFLLLKRPQDDATWRLIGRLAPAADLSAARSQQGPAGESQRFGSSGSVRALLAPRHRRYTLLLWLICFMNLFVNLTLISWLPSLLSAAGWSHQAAFHSMGITSFGGLTGAIILSFLVDRGHLTRAMSFGYLAAATALAAIALIPGERWMWTVALAVAGFGTIGSMITVNAVVASVYPAEMRATGVGWATGVGRIGGIVGPATVGLAMGLGMAPRGILGLLLVPLLACVLCAVLFSRAVAGADHVALGRQGV